MATPGPKKLHKRFAPSRTGSDLSCSTELSSSSTLVYEERFAVPTPKKPWAVKALHQLGLKCKKSRVFTKGKEKEMRDEIKESDEEPHISPYSRTPFPVILDINRETAERFRRGEGYAERGKAIKKTSSTNALGQTKDARLTNMKLRSTPDLRLRNKRDSSDPFYLEDYLTQFPRPPVHNPGDYAPRAPVNPSLRRQHSNFSRPTRDAYPEVAKRHANYWIDRPAPKAAFRSNEAIQIGMYNSTQSPYSYTARADSH